MAIREIRNVPDPVLHTVSAPAQFDPIATPALRQDMIDTMEAEGGRGLAAPQIGMPIRAVLIQPERGPCVFLLNPRITARSGHKVTFQERCLSVPDLTVTKLRNWSVKYVGTDEHGQTVKGEMKGIDSACFQHEVDHLEGRTIA